MGTGTAMVIRAVPASRPSGHSAGAVHGLPDSGVGPKRASRGGVFGCELRLTILVLAPLCIPSLLFAQPANQAVRQAPLTGSNFDLRLGAGHSDNVRRVSVNPQSDTYSLIGFSGGIERSSPRFVTSVVADIERRNYSDGTYLDEPYGNLDANVEVYAVPDRFSWEFSDLYGQSRIDPLLVASPLNQQQVNVLSTGPRLALPLGGRTSLDVVATRSKRTYEDTTAFDAETDYGQLAVSRATSATTTLSFTATSRKIDYRFTQQQNSIRAMYLGYRRQLASGSAGLSLGKNEVDFGASSRSSPYVDLSWARALGSRSNLSISVTNRLGDFGDNFGLTNLVTSSVQSLDNTLLSADVFDQTMASVTYSMSFDRSQLTLSARLVEERYEYETSLDSDQNRWALSYQRSIASQLTLGLDIYRADRDFQQSTLTNKNRTARLRLQRGFGQRLSLDFAYEHYSGAALNVTDFSEDSYRVTVRYRLNRRPLTNGASSNPL